MDAKESVASRSRFMAAGNEQKRRNCIQLVVEYIREGIARGEFKPGMRLPTETQMAQEIGVSRTPVREAVKALEAIGLLEARAGAGTVIRPTFGSALAHFLMFQLYLSNSTTRKLMEARRTIERGCAELAAKRRTEEDLKLMHEHIERLSACARSPEGGLDEAVAADIQFHRAVYKATGNELIQTIANFVLDMFEPWVRQSMRVGGPEKAAAMHRAEYIMIDAQNVGGARESFSMPAVDIGMDHWLESLQRMAERE